MTHFYCSYRRHFWMSLEERSQSEKPWGLYAFVLVAVLLFNPASLVQAQTVTDVRPESGIPGQTVQIHGKQLGGISTVIIGGTTALILSQSSTRLEVEVPSGVQGPTAIQVGTTTAAERFTVLTGGSTTFASAGTLAPTRNGEVTRGDFDGDNDLDLLVTGTNESGNATTTLYYNDGTGQFSVASDVSSALANVRNGTADFADVNGDGRLDILLTGTNGSGTPITRLYTNDGGSLDDGSLTITEQVEAAPASGFENSAVALGDLDADGDLDLIAAGDTTGSNDRATVLYENDGSGNFTAAPTPSSAFVDVENGTVDFGDVNGDDTLDVVVTGVDGGGSPTTTVYEYDNGTYASTSLSPGVTNSAVDLGDATGNGVPDLVVTGSDGSFGQVAEFFTNGGEGSFTSEQVLSPAVENGTADFVDVDGDGDLDLVTTGNDGDMIPYATVYEYDAADSPPYSIVGTRQVTPTTSSASAVGDYDGDGRVNLFFTGETSSSARSAILYRPALRITTTYPSPYAPSFSTSSDMEFTFSAPVAESSGLADSIVVRGSQHGGIGDDGSLAGGTETIQYGPTPSFAPGERVQVLFQNGLESTGGLFLPRPLSLGFRAAASKGPADFPVSRPVSTSETGARSVASGYLTGNGHLDLVVAAAGDDEVTLYEGNGDGTFSSGSVLGSGITYARALTLADLNGDGRLDVVVGSGENESSDPNDIIRYYLNEGSGSFGEGQDITNGGNADDVRDLEAEDFDGDGNVDLVAVTSDNNSIYVYQNNSGSEEDGAPTFTEVAVNSGTADDPRAVHVADVDGTGTPDLVVGSVSDDNISWYPNNEGTFGSEKDAGFLSNTINPRDLDAADLDGDQRVEIVGVERGSDSNAGDGAIAVYAPTSSFEGSIQWNRTEVARTDSALTATTADVNADGHIDIVAGSVGGDSLVWYENVSEGGFESGKTLDVGIHNVQDVIAVDVDGDGSLDPVIASPTEDLVSLYPNIPAPRVASTAPAQNTVGVDTSLSQISFSFTKELDPNSIGLNSVTLAGSQSGRISPSGVDLSSSSEELEVELGSEVTFHPGEKITASVLADSVLASDGSALDTTYTLSFRAATASGSGNFVDAGIPLTGVRGGDADWGDYDDDGDLDLILTGDSNGKNTTGGEVLRLYENNGDGTFTEYDVPSDFAADAGVIGVQDGASVEWGDYDQDGNLDLAVSGYNGSSSPYGKTRVYRQRDDGQFETVETEAGVFAGAKGSSLSWADYDGDGDLDLVVTGPNSDEGGTAYLYRYDESTNSFAEANVLTPVNTISGSDWGDVDNDGDLDLVVTGATSSGSNTNIYRNDGDIDADGAVEFGRLGMSSIVSGSDVDIVGASAEFGDVNGDGALDLLVTGEDESTGDPKTRIYVNENAGTIAFSTLTTPVRQDSTKDGDAAFGDFSGDGRLDVASVGDSTTFDDPNESQSAIFRNEGGSPPSFTKSNVAITPVDSASVAWGDYNGDGTLDLIVTGDDETDTPTATLYKQSPALQVTSTAPARHTVGVDTARGSISATFNKEIDFTTSSDRVAVFGDQSGRVPLSGVQQGASSRELEIVVSSTFDFQPGERVRVSVFADSTVATDGTTLSSTFTFQFTAAAQSVTPSFPVDRVLSDTVDAVTSVEAATVNNSYDTPDALVAIDGGDDKVGWFRNTDGQGGFSGLRDIETGFFSPYDVVPGDLDGDGTVGVIGVWASSNAIQWYPNDGAAPPSFSTSQEVTLNGGAPQDATTADLDGDGDVDPVAALAADDAVVWYENRVDQGNGFAAADTIARVPHPDKVAVADVDGNGTLDVISASGGTSEDTDNRLAWHANEEGDGSRWTTLNISTAVSGNNSGQNIGLEVGDVDGDGAVDVITSSYLDGTVSWFDNTTGDGSDWTRSFITQDASGPTDVAPFDLDGDGDLDVLYSDYLESRVAWVENTDGNGSFSSQHRLVTDDTPQPLSVTVADLNGDGQLDVLASGSSTVAWHPNTTIAPQVVTRPPSDSSSNGFTAEALVNPGGASTDVVFEYGEDLSFGADSTFAASSSPIAGDDTVNVGATVDTLKAATKYYYRVVATNSVGSNTGEIDSVTTKVADPPTVTADSARSVTDTSAVLYGTVNPGGDTSRVYLAFGLATADAPTVNPIDTLRTALSSDQVVSQVVDTLQPSTEYRYGFRAVNIADSTSGGPQTFTTLNVPPSAVNDTTTIDEDQAVTIPVLANDTDRGGRLDTSTVAVVDSPSVGAAEVEGETGKITYTPTPDSNGTDRFAYAVSDDSSAVDTAEVIITIEAINDLPLTRADTVSVQEGSAAVVPVLENDTDAEGPLDTTSVAIESGPSKGAASVTTEGQIRYEPDPNYSGPDSLRYTVADTSGARSQPTPVRFDVGALTLALPDTVEAGIVPVGHPRSLAVTVKNEGEILLTGLSASVEAGDSSDYALRESSLDDTLAVGESGVLPLRFEPSTPGGREARLIVTAAEGTADTATVRGRGVGVTVDAPPPSRGTSAPIGFTLEGGIDAITGADAENGSTLYVRKGGARTYRARSLSKAGQDPLQLQAQVPDTLVSARGIDYFAVVVGKDPAGRQDTLTIPAGGSRRARRTPRHLPVQFDLLRPPAQAEFPAESYRMVSVPAVPEQGVKEALKNHYGSYDRGKWRVLRWAAGAEEYQEFPSIDSLEVGEGFWLVTSEGTPPRIENGQTPDADQARMLTLEPGWNQVGSPFGYSVPWDTVQAASGLSGKEIDGPIAYRDSAYRSGQSRLMPWEAYFVFNAQSEPDTLVVPPVGSGGATGNDGKNSLLASGQEGADPTARRSATPQGGAKTSNPPVNKRSPRKAAPGQASASKAPSSPTSPDKSAFESASSEEGSYTLHLRARPEGKVQGGRPATVTLGLRTAAKTGRDRFDQAQAPPIGQNVRLGVLQKTGGRSVPHAESFKPSEGDGQAWRVRLTNRLDETIPVRLGLTEAGPLPPDYQRYILDLKSGRRRAPGARLELDAGAVRVLKVIVGTEAYAEAESEGLDLDTFTDALRGNYPNPFEDETTIAYTLKTRREAVTVAIYDVLGRRINTLTEGAKRSAGLHRVQWDGTNQQGRPVGSGVYFYRVKAEGFQKTRKMVLVR